MAIIFDGVDQTYTGENPWTSYKYILSMLLSDVGEGVGRQLPPSLQPRPECLTLCMIFFA